MTTKIIQGNGLVAFGDSFTVGSNAATPATQGYARLLANYIGGSFANYAQGSTGTTFSTKQGYTNLPVGYRKQAVCWMAGLNDLRAAGAGAYQKIEGNLRAFLASAFLKVAAPASACKRTGTWSSLGSDWGGKSFALGGTPMATSDINATLEYKFYGDNFVVGSYPTSGAGHYQDLQITIDDGSPVLFSLLGRTNETATYDAKVIQGLGPGAHTAVIRPVNSLAYTVVDYVGTLVEKGSQAPIFVGKVPHIKSWTQYVTGGPFGSNAIADTASAIIESVANEFADWGVVVFDPNSTYDYLTQCDTDLIHPTTAGQASLSQAPIGALTLV
jgi:lysophospholipase L1-like esterase